MNIELWMVNGRRLEKAVVVRAVKRRLSKKALVSRASCVVCKKLKIGHKTNREDKPFWARKQKFVKSRFTAIGNMKTSGLLRTNPGFVTGQGPAVYPNSPDLWNAARRRPITVTL